MSDLFKKNSTDDELEAILASVKELSGKEEEDSSAEVKEWSREDINRLIAATSGEEYVPVERETPKYEQEIAKFIPSELNTEIYSVKPMGEQESDESDRDVFSGYSEVDGQEELFQKSPVVDDFDPDTFELETVIIPDDVHKSDSKFGGRTPVSRSTPTGIEDYEPLFEETQEKSEEEKIADYKTRFFTKIDPKDIVIPGYDDNEPESYDKSGIVVRKGESNESGLDAMPTVMAAEDVRKKDEEKTKVVPFGTSSQPKKQEQEDVEGQIVFKGLVGASEDETPVKVCEDDMEAKLSKKRKQKAKTFKLEDFDAEDFAEEFDEFEDIEDLGPIDISSSAEKTESELGTSLVESIGEYTDPADRNIIHTKLEERVKKTKRNLFIMGAVQFVLVVFALLPLISNYFSLENPIIQQDSMILAVLNAFAIIAAITIDSERFFDSFVGIFKGKITADSATAIAVSVALVENTLSAITGQGLPVFGVVAVYGLFLNKLVDAIDAKRIFDNFSVCTYSYDHDMYAIHHFDNENEIFELGRGLLMGNAEMLYSSKVEFPSDFLKNSEKDKRDDRHIKWMILASVIASLGAGIAAGIVKGEFYDAVSVFTGALCLSTPIFGRFIPSFITFATNKHLNQERTAIVSLDAANSCANSNAVVMDSADIFNRSACTLHGMKDFKSMRIDVVLIYAAAMVIKSGGPLKECFEQVIDSRQDLLPPVRELVYEDKMGISARIYEQKVLLGNRNMLIHHNIQAPEKEFEDKYVHSGRKVIYLACNEQLAAMFAVSYSVDNSLKNYLKQLENNGIQVLVRTNDVNVTEELISSKFGLNPDNFKILSSVASRLFKRRRDTISDSLPAEIIHDGKATTMLKAIATACSMTRKNKLCLIIQILAMVLGVGLAAFAGCSEIGFSAAIALVVMMAETIGVVSALLPHRK